ncbi:hypothetical protein Pfo_009559 [Paulownia fortunei]|nr:hypothetical protein Pfo_009559 [Paulownia fortunei]
MDTGPSFCLGVDVDKENELPFGYRFLPTAFELLQYYLVPKLKGEELPSDYVRDLDVYGYDPEQLPLNQSKYAREDEAYFFVPVKIKLSQGEDLTRTTPSGYWKICKENVPICGPNGTIGFKNKLVFYHGKDPNGNKTDWKMVEYRSNHSVIPASNSSIESYVVCKVQHKVRVEEFWEEEGGMESSGEESSTSAGNAEAEKT